MADVCSAVFCLKAASMERTSLVMDKSSQKLLSRDEKNNVPSHVLSALVLVFKRGQNNGMAF